MTDEFATLEQLQTKVLRTKDVPLTLPRGDDQVVTVKMRFKALPGEDYDELVAKYPPTKEQRDKGITAFNTDTFPIALIAASSHKPALSYDDVKSLWTSPDWSDGERNTLWRAALEVNQAGLDVPFTGPDSDGTRSST